MEVGISFEATALDGDEITRAFSDRALFVEGRPEQRVFLPTLAIDVVQHRWIVMAHDDERMWREGCGERFRSNVHGFLVRVIGSDGRARIEEGEDGYDGGEGGRDAPAPRGKRPTDGFGEPPRPQRRQR